MWFVLAASVALLDASRDIWMSREKFKSLPPELLAWGMIISSLPITGTALLIQGVPEIQWYFWPLAVGESVVLSVATILFASSLRGAPLSQTQPIYAITVVFLLFLAPIITPADKLSFWGIVGVVAVAAGIYAAEFNGTSIFQPFREIFRNKGVFCAFIASLIYSVTSLVDKVLVEASSGSISMLMVTNQILISSMLGLYILGRGSLRIAKENGATLKSAVPLVFAGALNGALVLLHMWAIMLTAVPYLIAVKRTSIIGTSLWDYYVRGGRKPTWYRILGMFLVAAGVALIVILGKK